MRERVNKGLILLLAAGLMAAVLCGCVRFESTVDPSVTMPQETEPVPAEKAEPSPTPEPTAEPTAEPTPEEVQQIDVYDELGAFITGSDHYRRYISFENIQVYEQEEDTFVDMQAVNAYPKAVLCALHMRFTDETGEVVAECRLQTQDGQYLLSLEPGSNTLYAQVPTDMRITGLDFTIEYDESVEVLPDITE